MKLTASNIINLINQLDRDIAYNYVYPKTKTLVKIEDIVLPEGPIYIKRWSPAAGEVSATRLSISKEMLWRVANSLIPGHPVNFDRILGGSYNSRSALEALLAHTPPFYYCYPGRIEYRGNQTSVEHGHKHMIWKPDEPHAWGIITRTETNAVISELPVADAVYDSLVLPAEIEVPEMDINIRRRHAQIQVALYFIGRQLGFRTWIAQNDKGIIYQNKRIGEYEGIVRSLKDENLLKAFDEAARAAQLIDCIWFKNGHLMPAVLEVEHTTGVTSGLTRMKNFKDKFPPFPTRYVIVAPDEDRSKVLSEASKPQFRELETRYFPYSAVEELYVLCQRRKLRGVTEDFLDCYMEPVMGKAV